LYHLGAIFFYYVLSTLLPIDKIIGRIYPIFGSILLIGTIAIGISPVLSPYQIPELTLQNLHPADLPIF